MTELIIIRTENSEKVRNLLNREQINYQVFSEQDQEEFSPKKEKVLCLACLGKLAEKMPISKKYTF